MNTMDKLAALVQDIAENDPPLPELQEPMQKAIKVLTEDDMTKVNLTERPLSDAEMS